MSSQRPNRAFIEQSLAGVDPGTLARILRDTDIGRRLSQVRGAAVNAGNLVDKILDETVPPDLVDAILRRVDRDKARDSLTRTLEQNREWAGTHPVHRANIEAENASRELRALGRKSRVEFVPREQADLVLRADSPLLRHDFMPPGTLQQLVARQRAELATMETRHATELSRIRVGGQGGSTVMREYGKIRAAVEAKLVDVPSPFQGKIRGIINKIGRLKDLESAASLRPTTGFGSRMFQEDSERTKADRLLNEIGNEVARLGGHSDATLKPYHTAYFIVHDDVPRLLNEVIRARGLSADIVVGGVSPYARALQSMNTQHAAQKEELLKRHAEDVKPYVDVLVGFKIRGGKLKLALDFGGEASQGVSDSTRERRSRELAEKVKNLLSVYQEGVRAGLMPEGRPRRRGVDAELSIKGGGALFSPREESRVRARLQNRLKAQGADQGRIDEAMTNFDRQMATGAESRRRRLEQVASKKAGRPLELSKGPGDVTVKFGRFEGFELHSVDIAFLAWVYSGAEMKYRKKVLELPPVPDDAGSKSRRETENRKMMHLYEDAMRKTGFSDPSGTGLRLFITRYLEQDPAGRQKLADFNRGKLPSFGATRDPRTGQLSYGPDIHEKGVQAQGAVEQMEERNRRMRAVREWEDYDRKLALINHELRGQGERGLLATASRLRLDLLYTNPNTPRFKAKEQRIREVSQKIETLQAREKALISQRGADVRRQISESSSFLSRKTDAVTRAKYLGYLEGLVTGLYDRFYTSDDRQGPDSDKSRKAPPAASRRILEQFGNKWRLKRGPTAPDLRTEGGANLFIDFVRQTQHELRNVLESAGRETIEQRADKIATRRALAVEKNMDFRQLVAWRMESGMSPEDAKTLAERDLRDSHPGRGPWRQPAAWLDEKMPALEYREGDSMKAKVKGLIEREKRIRDIENGYDPTAEETRWVSPRDWAVAKYLKDLDQSLGGKPDSLGRMTSLADVINQDKPGKARFEEQKLRILHDPDFKMALGSGWDARGLQGATARWLHRYINSRIERANRPRDLRRLENLVGRFFLVQSAEGEVMTTGLGALGEALSEQIADKYRVLQEEAGQVRIVYSGMEYDEDVGEDAREERRGRRAAPTEGTEEETHEYLPEDQRPYALKPEPGDEDDGQQPRPDPREALRAKGIPVYSDEEMAPPEKTGLRGDSGAGRNLVAELSGPYPEGSEVVPTSPEEAPAGGGIAERMLAKFRANNPRP